MKKAEFVKIIADKSGATMKDTEAFLKAFEDTMMEDIFAKEDSIRLSIGTFSGYTKESAARVARNPKTGETIQVPAKVAKGYPKFKPSAAAKE